MGLFAGGLLLLLPQIFRSPQNPLLVHAYHSSSTLLRRPSEFPAPHPKVITATSVRSTPHQQTTSHPRLLAAASSLFLLSSALFSSNYLIACPGPRWAAREGASLAGAPDAACPPRSLR